ncbi:MAG: ChrR family anti-sigma-E factor [Kiloniellaceae bacterium]
MAQPVQRPPAHHFPKAWLLDYAAGSLPEAPSIVLAAHLALCPDCRAVVADCEAIGGALLAGLEPLALAPDALDTVLARIDAAEAAEAPDAPDAPDFRAAGATVPPTLSDYLGDDLDSLAWQPLAPGVDLTLLRPRLGAAGGSWPAAAQVSLVRLAPGVAAPRHTHLGIEATVIVQGGFVDEVGRYERGDAWIVDGSLEHQPVALDGETCLCLVYQDAPLKLTG